MAVVYFTSNASTGAGSLVETIANAQPGDVVRPDESVFERGSTIEIVLASQLNVDKVLTLDASPFRVRLNGGGTKRGAYVASGVVAEFTAFDFVACYSSPSGGGALVETSARATFNRCLFAGCDSTYGGGLAVQATGNATLNDCAVVGCRATVKLGGGVYASGDVVLNGVTAIGCASPEKCDVYGNANVSLVARNSIVGAVQKSSTATFSAVGSVVGVPSSTVGFVASPPDDLTVETWDANAWQSWDLRLLDDASGAPSPYRDSGDVGAMSRYDLEGNFRGRETNGVATCSPGAYETIQADLFWIGEPFPQEMVDLAPQNVRVSNLTLNPDGKSFDGLMTWEIPDGANYEKIVAQYSGKDESFQHAETLDGAAVSRTVKTAIKGRRYILRVRGVFADGSYTAWSYVDFVASDVVDGLPGSGQTSGIMFPSSLSVVNPSFLKPDGWATSRFATEFSGFVPTTGAALFVGETVSFVVAPPFAAALAVGADNVVIPGAANAYLVIGATRAATVGGTLAALKLGDYAELTSSTSLVIPAVEFGGANIVIDNVSVEINDGVIFAAEPRPAAITTIGSGGWADTTVGVSSLDVDSIDAQTVTVSIVKNDANKAAFVQYSTDDGATWQTVATTADVDEYELTVAQGVNVTVRVATATGWLAETVSTAPLLPVWTVSNGYENVADVSNVFEVATGGSNDGLSSYDFNGYGYF